VRPVRTSLLSKIRKQEEKAYTDASGGVGRARHVKSQIYGIAKFSADNGERTASAPALPERIAEGGRERGLVPHSAQVSVAPDYPINNMGSNLADADLTDVADDSDVWASISDEDLGEVSLVMTDSGKTKTVMVRKPSATQACIIDWINFTVLEDTFFKTARQTLVADDQIIEEASRQFEKIFGFGITEKRDRGMNFYRESWVLGDGMGFVCFGGQRATMLITLSGQGCQNAVPGWEKRLFDFLTKVAMRPSISRIDMAHDDIEGAYLSVDWAYEQYKLGGYKQKAGGRQPNIERVSNWDQPTGKGRTLTIGLRTSSKFCRFYEKGKKEGDKSSPWCRCEVEFKNTNTIIPFDVLLNPTDFFAAAYPSNSQQPVQSVEYRPSGVIFELTPQVRDSAVDVSLVQQVSNFVNTTTGVNNSPTLIKRELKTYVSLADGDVIVIGGMTETKDSGGTSGLPFFPAFMQSKTNSNSRSEIILVLQLTRI